VPLSVRIRQIHLGVQRRGTPEYGDVPIARGKQARVVNMGDDEETARETKERQRPRLQCRGEGADHQRKEEVAKGFKQNWTSDVFRISKAVANSSASLRAEGPTGRVHFRAVLR